MTISTASSRYSWVNLRYFGIMTLPPREKFSLLGSLSGGSNTPHGAGDGLVTRNGVLGGDLASRVPAPGGRVRCGGGDFIRAGRHVLHGGPGYDRVGTLPLGRGRGLPGVQLADDSRADRGGA